MALRLTMESSNLKSLLEDCELSSGARDMLLRLVLRQSHSIRVNVPVASWVVDLRRMELASSGWDPLDSAVLTIVRQKLGNTIELARLLPMD